MPRADRGFVWIVDLGMVAKMRPCLILSVPTDPADRVLVTLVPHTTSVQGTRFEVAVQAKFLHGSGVFDAQQVATNGSPLEEALHDNTVSPVPDQVAFKIDFPGWLATLGMKGVSA